MKALLWLLLVVLGVWAVRSKLRAAQARANAGMPRAQIQDGEPMLCCAQCNVHFPASEAVHGAAATVYCCDEHRRLSEKS
jgi:uncharacterized protein